MYSDGILCKSVSKVIFSTSSSLVKEGKLIVAGPFGKMIKQYRGLFIFNSSETTEVKIILDRDPTIRKPYFKSRNHPWYGSTALSAYLETADKIWKVKP